MTANESTQRAFAAATGAPIGQTDEQKARALKNARARANRWAKKRGGAIQIQRLGGSTCAVTFFTPDDGATCGWGKQSEIEALEAAIKTMRGWK